MATLTVSGVRGDLKEGQWQVGDRCLAPHPREKRLCEGTVQRLAATGKGDPAAVVRFACHDDCDEEQVEDTVAFSKLHKPVPSLDEKPLFHNHQSLAGASVPYALSGDGESIPYTINRYLRDYQREGAKFIYDSYARGRGCILGDDMGLGKTVQVIAFLAATLHKTGTWQDVENNVPHFLLSQKSTERQKSNKVFLIVAPLSVLYNWKDELDTWGYFRSIIVHGTRKEEEFARVRRGRCEVALTTYETLRLCLDQFNSIDWSAVIVDEAHKIKNPNSQITQAMKGMRCKVRVGLTGTILQNNLEELWCVMDWAIPGCLGTSGHFKNQFADPIELGHKHSGTKRNLATGRQAVKVLARRLSRWFLRRTKALISSQLPKKDDRVVYCSMTPFQETVYRTVLDSEDVNLILRSGQRCSCSSGRPRRKCCFKNNSKGVPVRCLYFSYLTILRKVSNHVALLQPQGSTSKKQEEYVNDICEKVFQKFPDFMQRCKQASFEAMSDPIYSGKMKVLQRLLKHFLQRKDKVLLFSLSTKLLDVLESYCMAEGVEYRRLDGNTKSRDRVKIVKEFNSSQDINVCLVSTVAGGLGLNFVGANVVVLFDPTWNPANDLQAIDRAYRIGQCRDVTVLRLISLGSVEEVIYLRQVYKQQLQSSVVGNEHARRYFEAVQGTDNHKGELFGIRNLFRLQTEGTCLTRQILEREGRVEAGVLTASTCAHAGDDKTREGTPEERSGREPTGSGVLDFSSTSEDDDGEEWGGGRKKKRVLEGQDELRPGGAPPGGRSLLHHGFSRLLQAGRADPAGGSGSEGGSGGESCWDSDDGKGESTTAHRPPPTDPEATAGRGPPAPCQKQGWTISSNSEGEVTGRDQAKRDISREMPRSLSEESDDIDGGHQVGHGKWRARRKRRDHRGVAAQRAEYDTDESGDIEVQKPVRPKHVTYAPESTNGTKGASGRTQGSGRNGRKSPNIESFTSSEDDLPAKKLKASRDRSTGSVYPVPAGDSGDTTPVKFTSVKKRSLKQPSNEKGPPVEDVTVGTIDRLLAFNWTRSAVPSPF
ncbi:DNA excision repair protein ERCC-6-like 2 isoform X2 [Megalops cyprinoides]|uniref:DNA excision repair protein ERCC-6-like 2 isoform X2 n=1 Tax=Megalops cyprinoides TaxID=118141 RepID=UPI001863EA0E|nr:DNA excision repair protein ERCC-6-like 2 isoform X2 [Megalops cyprinoides]